MKTYLGNYLGIVISGGQKDPEKRGRCQIFIPHIMPTLYEGWNETGFKETGGSRNIKIIGDNLQDSLTSAEIEKLRKILPWSECAAPAIGAGPSVRMANDNTMSSSLLNNGYKDGITLSLGSFGYSGGSFTDLNTLNQISSKASIGLKDVQLREVRSDQKIVTFCGRGTFGLALETYGPIYNPQLGIVQTSETYKKNNATSGEAEAKNHGRIYEGARVGGKDGPLAFTKIDVELKNAPVGAIVLTSSTDPKSDWAGHAAIKLLDNKWNWGPGSQQSYGASKSGLQIAGIYVPTKELLQQNYANAEYNEDVFIKSGGETVVVDNPSTAQQQPTEGVVMNSDDSPIPFDLGEVKAKLSNDGTLTDEQAKVATAVYAAAYQNARSNFQDVESSHIIASAIVGNVKQETNFDPNKLHIEGENGYGLLGWQSRTNDQRLNNLVYFAQQRREVPGINFNRGTTIKPQDIVRAGGISVNTQIDFLFAELNGGKDLPIEEDSNNSGFKNEFYAQSTPAEAALYLSDKVVRPGDPKNDIRQKVAENAFEIYSGVDPNLFAQIYSTPYSPYQHFVDIPSNPGGNSNNMPTGMFGYAMEGQAVWCFFREGDALFPVYFAASYGQEDWSRIYQNGGSGQQEGKGVHFTLDAGGMNSVSITDQDNTVFGPDNILEFRHNFGSVLRFTNSTSLLYSQYSHKQHVQQDYADIVMANREMRTFGDSNINVGQNQYIAVGKWDATAEEAANELQKIINEGMEIKSKEIQEQFKNGESSAVT